MPLVRALDLVDELGELDDLDTDNIGDDHHGDDDDNDQAELDEFVRDNDRAKKYNEHTVEDNNNKNNNNNNRSVPALYHINRVYRC